MVEVDYSDEQGKWLVVKNGEVVQIFPGTDAGELSALVLKDILAEEDPPPETVPEPEAEPEPIPEPKVIPEPVPVLAPITPRKREPDPDYPFPPNISCFWWPRNPRASLTGSFDGVYLPPNGDNMKLVLRKGETHGYLVALTRTLKHAIKESGALPGDIITITEAGRDLLLPSDRGPAQLFTVTVLSKRDDREEEYQPGVN